jgi:hypothetical protein
MSQLTNPQTKCMQIDCTNPPSCTLTLLTEYDPDKGSVPGNGKLINWEFCDDCARDVQIELLLAATDSTVYVTTIPYALFC